MGCTKEQWNEVYNKEYNRLRGLAAEGYDVEKAVEDLEAMDARMREDDVKGAARIALEHAKEAEPLTESEIGKINKNNPRLASGVKIKVHSGQRMKNGEVMYQASYPNSDKLYPVSDGRVWYDQIAPRYDVYGNGPDVKDAHTAAYEKLEYDIWNDQSNAMKLFDKMVELDGVNDEHTQYLKDLLSKITDPSKEILNAFKVYLNTEAEKNQGIAVPFGSNPHIKLDVVEGSMSKGGMSAAETYVHEILHMSVEAARQFGKGPLAGVLAEMRKLYDKAGEEIKAEEFPDVYEYIFGNEKAGISEFIAYAMTNKAFKARLNQIKIGTAEMEVDTSTIWGKVSNLVIKMYETIRDIVAKRDPTEKMDDRIGELVTRMWMHNKQTVEKVRGWDRISRFMDDTTDTVDRGIIKGVRKAIEVGQSGWGAVKGYAPTGIRQVMTGAELVGELVNPWSTGEARDRLDTMLTSLSDALSKNPLTKPFGEFIAPEGTLRATFDYIKEDDDEITRVEKFGLRVQRIDAHREHVIEGIGKDIMSKFKKLSHKDQEALTKALVETDVKVLRNDYTWDEIAELMRDEAKVDGEIAKIEDAIDKVQIQLKGTQKGAANNYYKIQAKLLGEYITTGKGYSGLNTNAQSIVEMKGTPLGFLTFSTKEIEDNKKDLIKMVDQLATMHAIKNANADAKSRTEQMLVEQKDAIENMLMYHEVHESTQMVYKLKVGSREETVKGEIKDLKANYTEMRLAKTTEAARKEMKRKGFSYVGDSYVPGVGVYKKWTSGMDNFDKQAVAKINEYKDMQNLVGVYNSGATDLAVSTEEAKQELTWLFKKRRKEFDDMLNGVEPKADGYIPITNHKTGEVRNFGLTVNRDVYAKVVDQDKKAPVLLAKMLAEIGEKLRAKRHNNDVLMQIYRDMKTNYTNRGELGENKKEYIEIGPDRKTRGNIAEEFAKDVWKNMPQNMRDQIMAMDEGDRYIAVRRDMAYMYFGMRSPSILNSKLFFMNDTLEHKLNEMGAGYLAEAIKVIGDIWQEIVALNALNIVIKTPMVILTNMLSNIAYSFSLGQLDPVTGMFKAFKDTKEYMDLEKEKIALTLKEAKGELTREDKARLKRIEVMQKENPVHDLMAAGLFTSVASDTALVDLKGTTRLGKWGERITDNIPTIIKDVGAALYVTEGTGLYNAALMATAYGDFVSRVNRYHYLQSKGVAKANALKMVTDEFVNYNRLTGAGWKWMKEMGFAQFMQYFFGAVKSMAGKLKHKPSSMVMMNMFMDIPNPSDAMPWNADLGVKFHDPFDIMFEQTPEFIMTPATLRFLGVV